ncbi:hypothetical protein ILYODFUR_026937 [Ilyodon furcidens]|uniref:Secreted protein n=1 Tax=Ilyodon furcidens TaxID=33524 RepID=A0ABV0TCR6_9TELE
MALMTWAALALCSTGVNLKRPTFTYKSHKKREKGIFWCFIIARFCKHNIFRITFGLFAAFLKNALFTRSGSFGGWPSLGRFVVVPCAKIMDLMVLQENLKYLNIFYTPP